MKTLEAKPFDQNVENWKRENRLFTSTVLEAGASGQNRIGTHALRSHQRSLIRFRCSNSCFLLETGIAGHERLPSQNDTPKPRKNCENGRFSTPWQAWKVVRWIAAVRQRSMTPRNWRYSFAFFESFLWHFNKKQRAEVIFRLSRPVSCKNQENGSGKQWSLHTPLKPSSYQAKHDFVVDDVQSFWQWKKKKLKESKIHHCICCQTWDMNFWLTFAASCSLSFNVWRDRCPIGNANGPWLAVVIWY